MIVWHSSSSEDFTFFCLWNGTSSVPFSNLYARKGEKKKKYFFIFLFFIYFFKQGKISPYWEFLLVVNDKTTIFFKKLTQQIKESIIMKIGVCVFLREREREVKLICVTQTNYYVHLQFMRDKLVQANRLQLYF